MGAWRPLRLVAAVVAAAAGLLAPAPGAAQSPGQPSAAVTADGWWSALPALPSTVGDQGLGVGARAGAPDKIAAVGIQLAAPAGTSVAELVLELREVAAPGAVVPPGAEGAMVRACPILGAWRPARSGPLAAAPRHDCAGAAGPGVRGADGTWRFDLTAVGRRWLGGGAPQHGVALVESVDPPASFQVAFQDRSTGTPRLRLSAGPARPAPAAGPAGGGPAAVGGPTSGGAPPLPAGAGGPPPTEPDAAPARAAPAPAGAPGPVETAGAPAAPVAAAGRGVLGRVPAAALLLVPVLLGVALATCLVIGDDRSPGEAGRRQGAVSRALAGEAAAR